jgi:hypothetical protein
MDEQLESARLRALLLASRNQMDWLWTLADKSGGQDRARATNVLKLIGAIDYALGIEPYTMELGTSPGDSPASAQGSEPVRPLDIG